MIVQPVVEPMDRFTALIVTLQPGASRRDTGELPGAGCGAQGPGQQEAGAAGGHVGTPATRLLGDIWGILCTGAWCSPEQSTHPDWGQTAAVTASPGPSHQQRKTKTKTPFDTQPGEI